MTAFFSRRGAGVGSRKPTVPIRVGHVYLDTRQQSLFCLNETAQQLLHEGVPLGGDVAVDSPLRTLEGEPIAAADLPMARAWRERTPQESTFLLLGADGISRHLTWNASPLADADGSVRGVVASLIVGPFEPDWQQLAGLAHDLRTPLQALRLLVPLLENTSLPPETRALLERIRTGMERTLSVSLDLLEWTREPTSGGRRVQRQWFALEPFLIALADEQAADAQRKAIVWLTDFAAARNREIHTDRVRLGRLLANLMSNAIRYTAQGEIRVRAGWRGADAGRPPLFVLTVEDTGGGISPEDQESIFQPFERGKSGKDTDSSGSGLGLAVVDRLVAELGLTLEIISEYGRGSKFEVLLPADSVRPIQH
jgi:signal transduction histidine kinase